MWFALLHQRFTGIVQLDQAEPAGPRTVWLEGGMPIYTDWLSPAVLGEVLVEYGLLSADGLAQALTVMAREGGLLGNVLLRLGLVEPSALTEGLRRQCARKLVDTFTLRAGEVLVTAGAYDAPTGIGKVNVLELISLGVAAHYDLARVDIEMGGALQGPVSATAALQRYLGHFRFRPADEPVIAALAQPTTLEDLARLPGLSRPRAAQILYTLWVTQMLRVGASAQSVDAPPSDRKTTPTAVSERRHTPVPGSIEAMRARRATPTLEGTRGVRRPTPTFTAADAPAPPRRSTASEAAPTPPPAPEPDAELGPDAFIAALEVMEKKIESNAHAFAVLGIELDAGKREVKRSFSELSRRFHPDALQSRGLGYLRARVSRVFAALSEAQMVLSDSESRENLKMALEHGVAPTSGAGCHGDGPVRVRERSSRTRGRQVLARRQAGSRARALSEGRAVDARRARSRGRGRVVPLRAVRALARGRLVRGTAAPVDRVGLTESRARPLLPGARAQGSRSRRSCDHRADAGDRARSAIDRRRAARSGPARRQARSAEQGPRARRIVRRQEVKATSAHSAGNGVFFSGAVHL